MNIIKERKKHGAVCPRCKHPDYTMHPPVNGETIKPEFRCKACGNSWGFGYDGGMYAELATPNAEHQRRAVDRPSGCSCSQEVDRG